MTTFSTRNEAVDYIIDTIGIWADLGADEVAAQFNIDAIANAVIGDYPTYEIGEDDPAAFWALVEANAYPVFTAALPEVGDMVIEHDGEDTDLVILPDGRTLPAVIGFTESEEWEPQVYRAALADAGWVQVMDWTFDLNRHTATVRPA